jgi:UDP-N-acetylglucosamine 1-carboxyvinyltransferase
MSSKIRIRGGQPLFGRIPISGAKNAALPLMCAALLTEEPLILTNVPYLADVVTMGKLLGQLGVQLQFDESPVSGNGRRLRMQAHDITSYTAPYDHVRTMRASVLVLGPLLARFGEAHVSLPGGCAIGTRPIDLHLKALEELGAVITLGEGYVHAEVKGRLRGAMIRFDKVSVGATENALMAAALAEGETILDNAACEPEITDLAHCLQAMGAKIDGIGTTRLVVTGVAKLGGATHRVVSDRIEAGTYAACAAITGGEVELLGADADIMQATLHKFEEAGLTWKKTEGGLTVGRASGPLHGVDVQTQPYPGFATDMQAQFMALMTMAEGAAMITETIFENRFMHAPELTRMGANITVHGHSALVRGSRHLKGAEVMATDLRASVAMVIAALAAEGETVIHRVYHLDRGYEALEEKLRACGADVERVA